MVEFFSDLVAPDVGDSAPVTCLSQLWGDKSVLLESSLFKSSGFELDEDDDDATDAKKETREDQSDFEAFQLMQREGS